MVPTSALSPIGWLPTLFVTTFRARLSAMPGGRVLLAGALVLGVLFVLTALNIGGQAGLWEDAHLAVAGVLAAGLGWIGLARSEPAARTVRFWAAIGLTLWAGGQVVWGLERALGSAMLPIPSDALWLAAGIPVFLAFRASFRSRLRRAQELAVYLDSGAVFWTVVSCLIVALASSAANVGGTAGFVILVYPALYFGMAGAVLTSAIANRTQLRASGAYALLGGLIVLGAAQTAWAVTTANRPVGPGEPLNYLFSIATLFLGFGAATWTDRAETSERMERLAATVQAAVPILSIGIAALAAVLADLLLVGTAELAVHLTVMLVVICTGVRQALLLRDRAAMVDDLNRAHRELLGALDKAERSELDQRRVADERGRALAASEQLLVAELPEVVLNGVLDLLVPAGAIGFVSRWQEEGRVVRVIAASGPNVDGLVGREGRVADLAPDVAQRYYDGLPRGFSHRGSAFVPPSLLAHAYTYEQLFATAASSVTLPFLAHDGKPLGSLNLIDPTDERILEPGFVEFARLVANQMAAAMQNSDLVDRLRAQIDEIRHVQDQLIQASKLTAVGELAAAVAHEVNNPLTGVLGYADLLLLTTQPDDPSRESLEVIRTEAIRARTVIWALLDFARPRPPERRPVDLAALVGSTVDLMRYHFEGGGVRITESYGDVPPVELDESAIRQVLLNLITNAAQAMAAGGTLTITTERREQDAVITIADTGIGMPEEVRARIFEPFFTTKPMEAGRGLGLSVSLGLVESHGGTIRVDSASGKGTTAEVRLPIAAPRAIGAADADDATDTADQADDHAAPIGRDTANPRRVGQHASALLTSALATGAAS